MKPVLLGRAARGAVVAFALAFAALAAQAILARPADAALAFVSSRAALGGNDFVDWGQLGPDSFAILSTPQLATSNLGNTVSVSTPAGQIQRFDQGGFWGGNFAPGDELIINQFTIEPLSLSFGNGVLGAGAQIQAEIFGSFDAFLDVYDTSNVLLTTFNATGLSTSAGDNSAIFLGVVSDTANIGRIVFRSTPASGIDGSFAINQLDLLEVPEPASLGLLAAGLLMLRRQRPARRSES